MTQTNPFRLVKPSPTLYISDMNSYTGKQWKLFRQSVIELDGYKCRQCGRSQKEVTLQVHHIIYKPGLKAWEYPTQDCITLCMGCHAREHGLIQPNFGWEYIGDEDLGDLIGTCENRNCGTSIRYSFTVYHKNWGTLEVGTMCCDTLTCSEIASNLKESKVRFESRQKRFINSKRWLSEDKLHRIKHGQFEIEIIEAEIGCSLKINGKKGKPKHKSLIDAKIALFAIIDNGDLAAFFKDKDYPLKAKVKKQKTDETKLKKKSRIASDSDGS